MSISRVPRRDRAWNEREYGREKWPAIRGELAHILSSDERDLSRAIWSLKRYEATLGTFPRMPVIVLGRIVTLPTCIAVEGLSLTLVEYLIGLCGQQQFDAIIELGSGWGRNLFDLWLRGGPRSATYIGAELTESGLQCQREIASLSHEINFKATEFDLMTPDLSFVSTSWRNILVFTVYSVSVLPILGEKLIESLYKLGCAATIVHFEPIGWQLRAAGRTGKSIGSSLQYAEYHDYNRDLWPMLSFFESQQKIIIEDIRDETYGLNPADACTIVRWSPRR